MTKKQIQHLEMKYANKLNEIERHNRRIDKLIDNSGDIIDEETNRKIDQYENEIKEARDFLYGIEYTLETFGYRVTTEIIAIGEKRNHVVTILKC